MLTEELPYCKLVSNSSVIKTRGSNKVYEEAIEASAKFNKRLIKERKTRLPFLDSQTTVAQGNCMIWNKEYQRIKPTDPNSGVILHYQVKKWSKSRRLIFENGDFGMLHRVALHPPMDLMQQPNEIEQLSSYILNSQHIAYSKQFSARQAPVRQTSIPINDDHKSVINNHENHKQIITNHNYIHNHNHNDWHMEDDENSRHDNDNDSDSDELDKRRKHNKSENVKKGGRSRKNHLDADGFEKNFICDQCNAKYKTRPGLSYHVQKAHNLRLAVNPTGSGSPMTVPISKNTREPVESIHADENTNSLFESAYDDNSSSLPVGSVASSNQNTNSNQPGFKTNVNGPTKCGVCFGVETEPRGQTNLNDKFITCSECSKYFHQTSCLGFNPTIMESVKKYKWLCIECKRCTICGNSENDDKLLFCDDCDRGYHMYCLNPPLTEAPAGDWRCNLCIKANGETLKSEPK